MSKCDSCSHSEVCKYKEEFQSFEQSQSPTDRPFCMVEVNCKYFSSKPVSRELQQQLAYARALEAVKQN
jgi:hypothetical protein